MILHDVLAGRVAAWRTGGYITDQFPAIAEILEWAQGVDEGGNVRFLRPPQLTALETYWYLRLVEGTPHILALYKRFFPKPADLLVALGLDHADLTSRALDLGVDGLIDSVRHDDGLVKQFKLEAVRETLGLDYPSYILALAMGAGKTILISAIIATEFAMALEYPDGPFVQNALVFAPGKTILESLRELLSTPYASILPPRFHKRFEASVKFTFTRDGDPDIPVIDGSLLNVVVTNTEKIRIQKETIRKSDIGKLFNEAKADDARQDVANRRLRKIASLPHLGIFSDEAHHTYGQSMDAELKKVRKTVDYLHAETNLICVVNTTGTPYFQRQPLRDVVIWYGLSQGIRDGILKDVTDGIQSFDFASDLAAYLRHVVRDFFTDYGGVVLPDGAPAKLAIYFPQTDDLADARPVIDEALVSMGLAPTLCLVNTSDATLTKQADIDAFNRLNDPEAPHRVVLLVNKGTEGWNCPSLFACALARRLKSSNNFVLQAASRCLRQVPGNTMRARIYLSADNQAVLDRQLAETYGENIETLNRASQVRKMLRLTLRKVPVPPILVSQIVRTVVRRPDDDPTGLRLTRPAASTRTATKTTLTIGESARARRVLQQVSATVEIATEPETIDTYAAAMDIAAKYRLDPLVVREHLARLYETGDVPIADLNNLNEQVETHTRHYEIREETMERSLALVREDAFALTENANGAAVYTTDIAYPVDRERLLVSWEKWRTRNRGGFGFHYDPIEFDSEPELSFFELVLHQLNVQPHEVEDVYFTGGITDPAKTDFFVEYKGTDAKWHRYTPDFVVRKKPMPGRPRGSGRVLIVEIKRQKDRDDPIDGANGAKAAALRKWEDLNPDRVKYEMIFAPRESVTYDQLKPVWTFATASEVSLPVPVEPQALDSFCHKWGVAQLEVFGSALRADFRPNSDIDFLVTFREGATPGLGFVHMREELAALVGRDVDLLTRKSIERSDNWIRRRNILSAARSIYVG